MKLRVSGGTLEVEIIEGELTITDVKALLRNMSKEQIEEIAVREKISKAGLGSKSSQIGKLNARPKLPI